MAGSSLIGNLAVSLSMETAAFNRSAGLAERRAEGLGAKMSGMGKTIAGLGLAMAGGALLGGITSAVGSAFEMASALSEASEKLGVTVEGLQRLRVAAQQTGVSNEQLDTALVKLNKSLGGLQTGAKASVAAFAAIGLSADDLKGKAPDQALRLIADQLNKIPDFQTRVALGSQIMGKGFAQLIPMISGGSAELEKYAQQSQKNGEISTADAAKLDDLADSWDMLKTRVGVSTANIIARVAGMSDTINAGLKRIQEGATAFDTAIANMARNAVTWVKGMVDGIAEAITGRLSAVWDSAKAKIESVRQAFFNLADKVQFRSYIPDMVEGIGRTMAELQRVMVDPALSATSKVGAGFQALAGTVGSLFGRKAGGIIGAIGSFASAIGPLFGRGMVKAVPAGNTIGMASGGSGVFGGRGGVDQNILSYNGKAMARVSKGEHFSVTPANQNAQRVVVHVQANDYFDAKVQQISTGVAAPIGAQAAMGGAQGAQISMARQQRRRL